MNPEHYARCICQLFRVHTGDLAPDGLVDNIDEVALRELMEHQPPLVEVVQLSRQLLTEDGLRVVGELVSAFEGAT